MLLDRSNCTEGIPHNVVVFDDALRVSNWKHVSFSLVKEDNEDILFNFLFIATISPLPMSP